MMLKGKKLEIRVSAKSPKNANDRRRRLRKKCSDKESRLKSLEKG